MQSIFTRILLWAVVTTVVAVLGLFVTARLLAPRFPGPVDLVEPATRLQHELALRDFQSGGPAALRERLGQYDRQFRSRHFLVDRSGRDLLEGRDLREQVAHASIPPEPPRPYRNLLLMCTPARGDTQLLIQIEFPFRSISLAPYLLWILLVVVGLGWLFSMHLARPLHRLRLAVERFGRGDLSVRIGSERTDEIGALARTFDDMADRIAELLTSERRLLQDVSHELRSPLARLRFAVELAKTSADRAASLDRIHKDVDRLSALVEELLALSRVEGDPASRVFERVRLPDLIREVATDCQVEANGRQVRLFVQAPQPAAIEGAPELLRRAVENLVRNAIRHSPAGEEVEIELRVAAGRGTLRVRDRGPGVPEELLESIFEPFFRVEADRSRSSGGTGLGLAIARRAVGLHGGRIQARNVHPGLEASIELPLSGVEDPPAGDDPPGG